MPKPKGTLGREIDSAFPRRETVISLTPLVNTSQERVVRTAAAERETEKKVNAN